MNRMKKWICGGAAAVLALTCGACALRQETAQSTADAAASAQNVSAASIDTSRATTVAFAGDKVQITGTGAAANGADVMILKGGTYVVSGTATDSRIVVNADDADVTIVLSGAQITCADSSAILVSDAASVTVYAAEGTQNTLTDGKTYDYDDAFSSQSDAEPDACIYSEDDLTLSGGGTLTVNGQNAHGVKSKDALRVETLTLTVEAAKNALVGKDGLTIENADVTVSAQNDALHTDADLAIRSGTLAITAQDDGLHADNAVTIDDGTITITAHEGIEGTLVTINGGDLRITAGDDGINAAQKVDGVTPCVEINGGEIEIEMGQGDTDGIDANGDLIINGGTIRINGQSAFDYDGKGELNGGELYVNGERITELTNQFGGAAGGGPGGENAGRAPDGESFPQRADGERPSLGTPPDGWEREEPKTSADDANA